MLIKNILIPGLKTISPDASMEEAERLMNEHHFRHLPVSDGAKLVGILSDRDVQRAMTVIFSPDHKHQYLIQKHKKVSEYMTTPVNKMKVNEPVEKLVREMVNKKISCMIIEDESSKEIGIITTEDLLILLLDKLESEGKFGRVLKKLFRPGH